MCNEWKNNIMNNIMGKDTFEPFGSGVRPILNHRDASFHMLFICHIHPELPEIANKIHVLFFALETNLQRGEKER